MRYSATDPRPTAHRMAPTQQPKSEVRSYSVGAEAQNAEGDETIIEVTVYGEDDLPMATKAVQAAVAALGPDWNAESNDTDE